MPRQAGALFIVCEFAVDKMSHRLQGVKNEITESVVGRGGGIRTHGGARC